MLLAAAIVLAIIEGSLPPIVTFAPGVRLGLSNVAVMYALFFADMPLALGAGALKAFFVAATRGLIAGILSLSGGILSIVVMGLLMLIFKNKVSYLILSVSGAVSHNIGQFLAISALYAGFNMLPYLPVLLIAGIVAGTLTAMLLRVIIPALSKASLTKEKR